MRSLLTFFILISIMGMIGQINLPPQIILDADQDNVEYFGLEHGFPDKCVQACYEDEKGLLWLISCHDQGITYGQYFFVFDGHQAVVPRLSGDSLPGRAILDPLGYYEGRIYGQYHSATDSEGGLFEIDTKTGRLRTFSGDYFGLDPGFIRASRHKENAILIVQLQAGVLRLVEFDLNSEEIQIVFEQKDADFKDNNILHGNGTFAIRHVFEAQGDIWINWANNPLLRIDLEEQEVQKIVPQGISEDWDSNQQERQRIVTRTYGDDGALVILPLDEFRLYHYSDGRFEFLESRQDLLLSKNVKKGRAADYQALASKTPDGKISYRLLKDGSEGSQIITENSNRLWNICESRNGNFIYLCTRAGLYVIRESDASSTTRVLNGLSTRDLLEVEPKVLLVKLALKAPLLRLDLTDPNSKTESLEQASKSRTRSSLVAINDSEVIYSSGFPPGFRIFNWRSKNTKEIETGQRQNRFAVKDGRVYYMDGEWLYQMDLESQERLKLVEVVVDGSNSVAEIMFLSSGKLAILGSTTFHLIDVQSLEIDIFDLEKENGHARFLSIEEDNNGVLWVGTFSNGIQLLDIAKGWQDEVTKDQGLSSNTVATLTLDDQGHIWAGTYDGICAVDVENRNVVLSIQDESMLADREANRRSATKLMDGRIAIGSVNGITLIDPKTIDRMGNYSTHIYTSKMSWFDGERSHSWHSWQESNSNLELPADFADLQVEVALDAYRRPESHSFSYRVNGGRWVSNGSSRTIHLTNLEPGDYKVEIVGADAYGKESVNAVIFPLTILPHFYQTWWFMVLCALPFILFAIAWVRRARKIQVELEMEVASATDQLRQDKVLIEQQAEDLKEVDRLKTRFFTNISHEFRTPLSVISGLSDSVSDHADQAVNSASKTIKRNAQVLLTLINQILDLRKLESGKLPVNKAKGDVRHFLEELIGGYSAYASAKGIDLSLTHEGGDAILDFDHDKLYHVVSNLVSNAIKFTHEGEVNVALSISESQYSIAVRDTGIGIPKESLGLIFDRFYQVDSSSTREGEGTGIGLNYVKELIASLDGDLKVESVEGTGSTFTVRLPLTRVEDRIVDGRVKMQASDYLGEIASEKSAPGLEPAQNKPGQKLLIVEDNEDLRHTLEISLRNHYEIIQAGDGQEGLETALELVPDIIISDVMMPKKDGIEMLNELKNDSRTSHIPIVILTAKADLESRLVGLRRGADDYVSKPFDHEELSLRCRNILLAQEKIHERYRHGLPEAKPAEDEHKLEDEFIQKLIGILDDHLDNSEFSVQDFSKAMGVSRMQLHNKVKALTGLSTSVYLRKMRLQRAAKMLSNHELNISEIVYAVGFNSPSYFSKHFAEEYGKTPTEFREEL